MRLISSGRWRYKASMYAWCADSLSLISTSRPPVSLSTVASTPLPKVLNAAVIPYYYIVQSDMTESRVFPDSSGQRKFGIKYA